jgi:DNA-binding NarL/FixJ family response regulator
VDLQVDKEEPLTTSLRHEAIDVFVAHRSLLFTEALCELITKEHDLHVIGHACDAASVRSAVAQSLSCVVLLDAAFAADANDLLALGARDESGVRVILIAKPHDDQQILVALRYGIRGVILESMGSRLLVSCIRKVAAGQDWIEQSSAQRLLLRYAARTNGYAGGALSRREIEVVRGIARGLTNREIGRELLINPATVKSHVHNVFRKLNVTSRVAVNNFAREHGLV